MATTDEKVVSLKFDNAQFEKNIKQSMNSLDEFDKQVSKVDKSDVSMAALQKAFSNAEISATQAGFHIRDVWLKVSTVLEYQIARKIVNVGKKIANALTLEGINDGLQEYELQMNSIQTIMANTGANVETVNKYLDELNEYADKTIYNFSQMTRNIGLFTAAGVKLKESTYAIKGIANLAAVSGSDSTKASMAMYQMSQALATGTVRLQDWNSVVNAGMGGKVFQTALIRTSEVMKTGAEEAIAKYGNFRDSLTKGAWLTSDVLAETLAQIAGAYSEAELLEKGYTAEQTKDILELAETAISAATDVKTFTQLIDTIKEAIGSGWALSFRTIIGDFNEAKDLYSQISKIISGIIDKQSDSRNEMLQTWKEMGGRGDIINTLINLYNALNRVLIPIKEAWNDIFGWKSGALQLKNITRSIANFTSKLKLTGQQMLNIRKIFTAVFSTANTIGAVFKEVASTILSMFGKVLPVGNSFLDILGLIADKITAVNKSIEQSGVIKLLGSTLGKALTTITKVVANLLVSVVKLIDYALKLPAVQTALNVIGSILLNIVTYVTNVIDAIASGKNILDALNLPMIVDILGKVLNIAGLIAGTITGTVISAIKKLAGVISGLFSKKNTDNVEIIEEDFVPLASNIERTVQTVNKASDDLNKSTSTFTKVKDKIVNGLSGIVTAIRNFYNNIDINKVKEFLATVINVVKVAASLFIVWTMSKAIVKLGEALEYLGDIFEQKAKSLQLVNIKNLATAILYLAASLAILGNLQWYQLLQGGIALTALSVGLYALSKVMNGLDISGSLPKMSMTLLALTGSVLMLAGVVSIFSKIAAKGNKHELAKGVIAMLLTLAASLGSFIAISWSMKKFEPELKGVTKIFMGLGFALLELAGAICIFAVIPEGMFMLGGLRALSVLAALVGSIVIMERAMKKCTSMKGVASTIMAFAGSLLLIIAAIKILNNMEWGEFLSGLGKVIIILGTIGGLTIGVYAAIMALAKKFEYATSGIGSIKLATTILAFAGAVMMIGSAITTFSTIPVGGMFKSIIILGSIVAAISLTLGILSTRVGADGMPAANNMIKVAIAFGVLALAINLLVPALLLLTAINTLNPVGAILSTIEIIGVIAILARLLTAINNQTHGLRTIQVVAIVALVAAIGGAIAATMYMLKDMDVGQILSTFGGLTAIIAAMGFLVGQSSKLTDNKGTVKLIATILSLAAVFAALILTLNALEGLDYNTVAACLLGISAGLVAFALAMNMLDDVKNGFKSAALMLVMAGTFAILSVSLRLLEGIEWDNIKEGMLSVAVALMILLTAGALIGFIPELALGLEALAAILIQISGSIATVTLSFTALNISLSLLAVAFGTYGLAINEFIVTFFTNIIEYAPQAALAFVESIALLISGLISLNAMVFEAAATFGSALIAGFIVGFTTGIPLAIFAIQNGCQSLEDSFRSFWGINSPSTKMAELGSYLIAGLVQGLSNAGGIIDAASDMANGFIDKLKNIWGIHSPSTLMANLAGNLVTGFASGLANNAATYLLGSQEFGQGVINEVGSYINYNNGFSLGASMGGGTLDGLQSLLSQYGLSIDMITGSGPADTISENQKAINRANARLDEIKKERTDAWKEYNKEAIISGRTSVAAQKEYEAYLAVVEGTEDEYKELTGYIQACEQAEENRLKQEENAAAAAEEAAAKEQELAKYQRVTQEEAMKLTDAEVKRLANLRETREKLVEDSEKNYQNYLKAVNDGNKEAAELYKTLMNEAQSDIEDVDAAINKLVGTEEEAVEETEDVAEAVDDLGSSAGSASDSVDELEDKLESIQSVLDEYKDKWTSVRDEIMNAFNPFSKAEADTNEVGDMSVILDNLQSQINKNASWGAVQDALYNRLEAIGAVIGDEAGADLAQEWLAGLDSGSTEEVRAILNSTDEELTQFVNLFSTEYGQAGHLANIQLQKMKEDTEKELAELLDVVSIRLEDVANVFDGTAESIIALQDLANNDWYQKITKNVPLLSDDIKDALEDGWSLENLATFGTGAVDNINTALGEAVLTNEGELNETGSSIAAAMIAGVTQEFSDGSKSVEEAKKAMANALANPTEGAMLYLKDALEIGSPSQVYADEIGWWMFKGIVKGLWDYEGDPSAQIEVIDAAMEAMLAHVKLWVDTVGILTLHETGSKMTEYLVDTIGGMQSNVPVEMLKSCMDNLSNIATEKLESHYQDFYDAGVYLIQGLIDGINSMAEALSSAIEGLMGAANEAVTITQGINSPSKVWATFGGYMVEGLILGMDQKETNLEESTRDLLSSANNTASMIAYALAAAMADDDYQPTITPVVDLSEIQNGAYLASRMWDNSPASNLSSVVRNNEIEAVKNARADTYSTNGEGATNGGISFVQNNYSPKALSRLEIYRQTRNQIHQLKGALS